MWFFFGLLFEVDCFVGVKIARLRRLRVDVWGAWVAWVCGSGGFRVALAGEGVSGVFI